MPFELHQPRSRRWRHAHRGAAIGAAASNALQFPRACIIGRNSRKLEQALADIVESTSGLYIAQSEIDMIRMARGEWDEMDEATFRTLRDYIRPGLSDDEFRLWCKRYATCFIDATSWMEAMRKFDFVAGPRFHGVMLAMQAGTPGGVIAHDSRTLEMCETMLIPVRMHHDMPARFASRPICRSLFEFEAASLQPPAIGTCESVCRHADCGGNQAERGSARSGAERARPPRFRRGDEASSESWRQPRERELCGLRLLAVDGLCQFRGSLR